MKRNVFIILLIGLLFLTTGLSANSKPKYFSDNNGKNKVAPDPIYSKMVIVPVGYTLSLRTNNTWSTKNFSVPDKVYAFLSEDFYYNKHIIAPQGSIVQGMVVKSIKGDDKQEAQLQIKFTTIITPEGQVIPITALVKNSDKNGIIKGDREIPQDSVIDIILKQAVTYIPL